MINDRLRDPTTKRGPLALVGMDELTGKAKTPEEALDWELRALKTQFFWQTTEKVCGHPSVTVAYAGRKDPRLRNTTRVVSVEVDGRLYAAIVTTMSTRPDDRTYLAAQQAMLDGFVVEYVSRA